MHSAVVKGFLQTEAPSHYLMLTPYPRNPRKQCETVADDAMRAVVNFKRAALHIN